MSAPPTALAWGALGTWPALGAWGALFLLGALHGVNPAMGWLFAVALGVQRGERRAVWRALPPLVAGHALAIAAAVGLAVGLGLVVPPAALRWGAAAALLALGVQQLRGRHAHGRLGRWRVGGMRVGPGALTAWSFVVATAHGAGLMAAPLALRAMAAGHAMPDAHAAHGGHGAVALASIASGAAAVDWPTLTATAVHTGGYLLVTGLLATVVHARASLHLLRRAWINVDLVWAGALVLTALALTLA